MNAGAMARKRATADWSIGELVQEDKSFPVQDVHRVINDNFNGKFSADALNTLDRLLGDALSTYRSLEAAKFQWPKLADELKWIERLRVSANEVARNIDSMPPRTEGLAYWDRRRNTARPLQPLLSGLKDGLATLSQVLDDVETAITEQPGLSGGAPRKRTRDDLLEWLAETLVELGPPRIKSKAPTCAAEILKACQISAPADGGKRQRQRHKK